MQLYGHPVLKFRTKDKLHISKEPGLISWATLVIIAILGIALDFCLFPDNIVTHVAFLTMCLLLGLNLMETWEDFIIDREENLVTFVNRSWYHGFSMKIPEENVKRFPVNFITSVTLNSEAGIDILKNDGSYTTIATDSQNSRCLGKLRKEIATFLHFEKIEYLAEDDKVFYDWDVDPWTHSHRWSDNQDSDTETHDSNATEQDSQFQYERNIKIISGPS